jgi:hypothetical protein
MEENYFTIRQFMAQRNMKTRSQIANYAVATAHFAALCRKVWDVRSMVLPVS